MSTFGEVLKKLRLEKSLTQTELADKLGISKSTISMYENGNREPDFETLEHIADFFNVNLSYLIGETSQTVNKTAEKNGFKHKVPLSEGGTNEFPEGFKMIRRAAIKLNDKEKEKLLQIMKAYIADDEEDEVENK